MFDPGFENNRMVTKILIVSRLDFNIQAAFLRVRSEIEAASMNWQEFPMLFSIFAIRFKFPHGQEFHYWSFNTLIGLLIVGYSILPPSPAREELAAARHKQDSIAALQKPVQL